MKKIFIIVAAFVFIGLSHANASLVVGNLGTGDRNLWNEGPFGQAFTTGTALTIDEVTFVYGHGYTPTGSAYLEIVGADGVGKIDFSNVLDTWTSHTLSSPYITYSGEYTLDASTTYWLVVYDTGALGQVANGSTYSANFGATLPVTYNNYESAGGGSYYSLSDSPMRFEVNAVPIPGAVWLLGSGLIGILGIRRKMKQ
jgi:hypothetical protein